MVAVQNNSDNLQTLNVTGRPDQKKEQATLRNYEIKYGKCSFILINYSLVKILVLLFKTTSFQFSLVCFESVAI